METFILEKYGMPTKHLTVGQKVQCEYYCEGISKSSYRRTLLSKIIDKRFVPVKLGVIIGDAGVHPYWLGIDGNEQYLNVKFKEYILPKPIPISCIYDALEAAHRLNSIIEEHKDKIGQKGFSAESYRILKDQVNKAMDFAEQPHVRAITANRRN